MQQVALRESADASNKYLFLYLFIFLICTQFKTKADLKWVTTQLSEKTDATEVSNNHQYPLMLTIVLIWATMKYEKQFYIFILKAYLRSPWKQY